MYNSGIFIWFFGLMRQVGEMAFTNYLSQSISGTIIFMVLVLVCLAKYSVMKYIALYFVFGWFKLYGATSGCTIFNKYFLNGYGGN